jgi:hypothetical protein
MVGRCDRRWSVRRRLRFQQQHDIIKSGKLNARGEHAGEPGGDDHAGDQPGAHGNGVDACEHDHEWGSERAGRAADRGRVSVGDPPCADAFGERQGKSGSGLQQSRKW